MLHLISTNNKQLLQKLVAIATPEDTLVVFENIVSPENIAWLQNQFSTPVLEIIREIEHDDNEKQNDYDNLVQLCTKHSCIQNWY